MDGGVGFAGSASARVPHSFHPPLVIVGGIAFSDIRTPQDCKNFNLRCASIQSRLATIEQRNCGTNKNRVTFENPHVPESCHALQIEILGE